MQFFIIFIALFIVSLIIEILFYIDKHFYEHECYKCKKNKKHCTSIIKYNYFKDIEEIKYICEDCNLKE
jgi:uncharacterized membrane protein